MCFDGALICYALGMLPTASFVVTTPAHLRRDSRSMTYGVCDTPFGAVVIALLDGVVRYLAFIDRPSDRAARALLKERFSAARLVRDDAAIAKFGKAIFTKNFIPELLLEGSPLQLRVWQALLDLAPGATMTYGALAKRLGVPGAVRAVGTACGRNPIAYLVPCHRVLARDGRLGGYRWGVARKEQILRAEKAL